MGPKSKKVVDAFISAVNTGSVERISERMTEGHVFIDSDGAEYRGKDRMVMAWEEYLAMVPDYRIIAKEMFVDGATVMVSGEASGTFSHGGVLKPENHWKVPAAWRAETEGNFVAVWQVYVNPGPMEDILKRIIGS